MEKKEGVVISLRSGCDQPLESNEFLIFGCMACCQQQHAIHPKIFASHARRAVRPLKQLQ